MYIFFVRFYSINTQIRWGEFWQTHKCAYSYILAYIHIHIKTIIIIIDRFYFLLLLLAFFGNERIFISFVTNFEAIFNFTRFYFITIKRSHLRVMSINIFYWSSAKVDCRFLCVVKPNSSSCAICKFRQ